MPSLVPRHPAMLPSATLSEGLPRECADCPGTVTSRCRPRREHRWASPLVFPRRRRWAFIDFDASLLRNTWKPLSGKSVASREAQDGHQPRQVGGGLRGGLAPGACVTLPLRPHTEQRPRAGPEGCGAADPAPAQPSPATPARATHARGASGPAAVKWEREGGPPDPAAGRIRRDRARKARGAGRAPGCWRHGHLHSHRGPDLPAAGAATGAQSPGQMGGF